MPHDIISMTHAAFSTWLTPIINCPFFESRERLVVLLAKNADRDALEAELCEFYEGYCGLAFELEEPEDQLLSILRMCDTFASLQARIAAVKTMRKTSPAGRIAKRMSDLPLITDPEPEIEVRELPDDAFRRLMETLANWELFATRERVVKLQKALPSVKGTGRLKSAFFEFFVCYLELEQFLEDYHYDPDEGLELRPEVAERLEHSVAEHESGEVKAIPIEEVAKKLGLKW
ncbi:hypothetical protein F4X88_15315 [Candidatus Poribacteria bacterium]|nr:hypothetical protein [Candidatus Poribacteria bacterium]MXV85021.1 hypothetical protein [Candidatus Poribacteria bacterium]MYA57655.1 hypothetical protein [Candidatus Poribacteria bacterium]